MNELEILAAEYVLGTLDGDTRDSVSARRINEPELDSLISEWDQRLSPLLDLVDEATPKHDLYTLIENALEDSVEGAEAPVNASQLSSAGVTDELARLRSRVNRWRAGTVSGFGIAAALLVTLLLGAPLSGQQPQQAGQQFVAVFQQDDTQPAFLMNVDLSTRKISVRPVSAEGVPGKTYQLWIKSEALGPGVRSLGLLDANSEATQKQLDQYDATLLRSATFGISLEPEGGSPTGKPTGPAIHGKLYDTTI